MKTSNKILLGTFLTIILVIVSVHIALYAKYKKGDYTLITDDMWPTNLIAQPFKNIQYVSVSDLYNVTVEGGDSTILKYPKGNENSFRFLQKGDTLFLTGKPGEQNHRHMNLLLHVTLAGKNNLIANNSSLVVNGLNTPASSSWNVAIDHTELTFQKRESDKIAFFDSVSIAAANDSKLFLRNANFKKLQVTLHNSSIEDADANADSLFIATDSRSKIALKASNLLKAKISSNE